MTKTDFINNLDFEVAKNSIAKKLGIKSTDLDIKPYKSGNFKINLKNVSGNISPLFSGARKAVLITDNLNIKETKDTFSYEANIALNLKNNSGEYISKIGKIGLNRNKFVFYTMNDIKTKNTNRNTETNKTTIKKNIKKNKVQNKVLETA